jgi:hypothetical protein
MIVRTTRAKVGHRQAPTKTKSPSSIELGLFVFGCLLTIYFRQDMEKAPPKSASTIHSLARYTAMVRIEFNRSYWLALIQTAAHAAAAVISVSVDLPLAAKTALVIAIVASLVDALRRHAFMTSHDAIVSIELRVDGTAAVYTRGGACHDVRILGTTYVTPQLSVLNLRRDGNRGYRGLRHVLIVPDMVTAEDFRYLRVFLRWQVGRETTPTSGDSAGGRALSMRTAS